MPSSVELALFPGALRPYSVLVRRGSGITVTGIGHAPAPADRVELMLAVVVSRAEPGPAFEAASRSVTSVLAVLADGGVDSRHVRTADLSLGPRTTFEDGRETVVGYAAGQRLVVVLEGLGMLPRLLGNLATTGIEGVRFDGISFFAADPSGAAAAAREEAMAQARRKATHFAQLAARQLGAVLAITESVRGGSPIPLGRNTKALAFETMAVAPGESEVTVTIEVRFALA